ncbi:MAG: alanine dehydrogenase [Bacteroidetes bacterium]|nr:alanine dehydrogenase [Bacteroidota bacterium]MBS1670213.1 alanine dehydrogenase [Bacteroidota bacterium]
MLKIGLIKEGKLPVDNRVALTPAQCKWLMKHNTDLEIFVQSSINRCFSNAEYEKEGIKVVDDISCCNILLGIKEVPIKDLIENKIYLFFSHTKKLQLNNQALFHAMMDKQITLIDYECLEHEDGQRILGFGFFAGIVGAHNGIMCYGNRTKQFNLNRVFKVKDYRELIHTYFGLKLPPLRIAVTGSGRVAHGIIEIMNLMDIQEVEPDDYLEKKYTYPVYVHLKGHELYTHKSLKTYKREHFHAYANEYRSRFLPFTHCTDILLNGVYWDTDVPRLFEKEDITESFTIETIADITDDKNGSVPINLGDQDINNPVYGIDRNTLAKTEPYLPNSIDVMAVGNLPNELPRDASRFFGEQLIKHVLPYLINQNNSTIERATLIYNGKLTAHYKYMSEYAIH